MIRCTASPGESAPTKHLVTWAAGTWERHRTQAQPSLRLCGAPENLSLSGFGLGSARNSMPSLDSSRQSSQEPEQCRRGKHTHRERGQTQCGPDSACTPGTRRWRLFAVLPPPCSTTEQVSLNKWPPLPPVSEWNLDTEETWEQGKPK